MAGTINLALSQQFDMDGEPLGGGLLYFFAAGTTTPQSAFQDTGLTIVHPNPIVLDASGRVPMFYLADGSIKIRLTDDSGVTVMAADNLLVIGPSSGGGGGGGVDPNTVLQTGDILARFGTGAHAGFLPCNGSTMGSGTSGSTYAAAENQALFEYLWSTTVLQVFAGGTPSRGATANADWTANKRIVLPDLRGRTIAGVDDMGATAAGRLSSTYFGTSAIVLGAAGGTESHTLTTAQLASHSHPIGGSTGGQSQSHLHSGSTIDSGLHEHAYLQTLLSTQDNFAPGTTSAIRSLVASPTTTTGSGAHTHNIATGFADRDHTHALPTDTSNNGSGGAHNNVQPSLVMTFYIKL